MFIRPLVGSEIRKGEKPVGPELVVDWEGVGGETGGASDFGAVLGWGEIRF